MPVKVSDQYDTEISVSAVKGPSNVYDRNFQTHTSQDVKTNPASKSNLITIDPNTIETQKVDLGYMSAFAFQSAPDPVLILDKSGRILMSNPSAQTLLSLNSAFDVPSDTALKKTMWMTELLADLEQREALSDWICAETYWPPHNEYSNTLNILGQDGFCIPVQVKCVKESAGHICVFMRDVSERQLYWAEKDKEMAELKTRTEMKTRFLAAMSHEIRTPFTAVSGLLDMLSETDLDVNQRALVTTGQDAALAVLEITDDILDYTKLASGKLFLTARPFDIKDIFDKVYALFEPSARKKGLKLYRDIADVDAVTVMGDLPRLQQVLMNFVSNAIKFTHKGSVTLWAGTQISDDGTVELTCVVKDTGVGISMDAQSRLFGEFYQVEGQKTVDRDRRSQDGTGLGLVISKTLIRMMDGLIGVNSGTGQGSNFWISVPFKQVDASCGGATSTNKDRDKSAQRIKKMTPNSTIYPSADTAEGRAHSEAATPDCPDTIAGVNILLADDNKTNQMILSRMLESLGADVTVVNNGQEALEVIQAAPFDVALMDISMPVMGGPLATKRIRTMKGEVANLPVLALTAIASEADKARYLEAGMNAVLIKPVSKPDILRHISYAIKSAQLKHTHISITQSADLSLFDSEILASIFEWLEPQDIASLEIQFTHDLRVCIEALGIAANASDIEAIQKHSHILKGLAATFGCMPLSEVAELTNYNAISGSISEATHNAHKSVWMGEEALVQVKEAFKGHVKAA